MNQIFKFCIVIFIFLFLILNFSYAAEIGLVPCGPSSGGSEQCTFCHFLTLGEKVIDFTLYYIAVPLVVIFIIYGGFVILTAGDSPEKVQNGRGIITSAVIGLLIALLAWLLIDIILQVISKENVIGVWWNPIAKINCL